MPIDLDTVDPWDPDNEGCLKEGYEQCEKCGAIFDIDLHHYDITDIRGVWLCTDCCDRMVEAFMHGKKGENDATVQD